MKKKFLAGFGLFLATVFNANAALVTIESVDIDRAFNETDLATYWASITPTSSQAIVDPSALLFNGSANNDTLYKLTAEFMSATPTTVDFLAGLDAGHGAEIFVNGVLTVNDDSNLWWRRDFNNADVIGVTGVDFAAGMNSIVVYWGEDVNSGGNSFQITETALDVVDASAPAAAILFGLGFAGLAFSRRK